MLATCHHPGSKEIDHRKVLQLHYLFYTRVCALTEIKVQSIEDNYGGHKDLCIKSKRNNCPLQFICFPITPIPFYMEFISISFVGITAYSSSSSSSAIE
jgi:hypothetical protein